MSARRCSRLARVVLWGICRNGCFGPRVGTVGHAPGSHSLRKSSRMPLVAVSSPKSLISNRNAGAIDRHLACEGVARFPRKLPAGAKHTDLLTGREQRTGFLFHAACWRRPCRTTGTTSLLLEASSVSMTDALTSSASMPSAPSMSTTGPSVWFQSPGPCARSLGGTRRNLLRVAGHRVGVPRIRRISRHLASTAKLRGARNGFFAAQRNV